MRSCLSPVAVFFIVIAIIFLITQLLLLIGGALKGVAGRGSLVVGRRKRSLVDGRWSLSEADGQRRQRHPPARDGLIDLCGPESGAILPAIFRQTTANDQQPTTNDLTNN